ncbi:Protease m1 zinc metalloprotease [Operophtera brumata]|uniref:Protease m1 zinc metalloprotease n=1 Tax=Operophtera brumata TaxID=104452 RepID=A0A0L7KPA8_OPEBR|nr:Protease m1 zinc metalloprotease [Operophtera brumata]
MVSDFYSAQAGRFGSAEHIIEKSLRNIKEEARWSSENIPVISKWLDGYIANSNVKDDKFIGAKELPSIACE